MGWTYLGILTLAALIACCCGFKKYVWFLSIGYGFAIAVIGIVLIVFGATGKLAGSIGVYLFSALFVLYGARLSGFLLQRELKNAAYKKTLDTVANDDKVPVFVKFFMWIFVSVLYVMQTSPVYFRMYNGDPTVVLVWVGLALSCIGLLIETFADLQKSAQKKLRPQMVATEGLYKLVRCPNYFGEILFWTGVFLSGVTTFCNVGQWIVAVLGYICIVYIMFNGAQRLEKRQVLRYGKSEAYNAYANKTPIILPLIPIYHLNNIEKLLAEAEKKADQ
ncbi:MAG: DUF1295 domain-containing protein [Clostridia bacterium]|nr:DUF1295 domain-containing protein [Clostridia bacterium]